MRRVDQVKIMVAFLLVGAVVLHIFHADDWLPSKDSHELHQRHRGLNAAAAARTVTGGAHREGTSADVATLPPQTITSAPPPSPLPSDQCFTKQHTEYDGQVVMWGPHNIVQTAGACCELCRQHRSKDPGRGCTWWVYCPTKSGCNGQLHGECWGKHSKLDVQHPETLLPPLRANGDHVPWMSGAAYISAEAAVVVAAEEAAARTLRERRERPSNPKVFFDVRIVGGGGAVPDVAVDGPSAGGGRIEFILYAQESPRASENFKRMCVGNGKFTFQGMSFYRIIDKFIDQSGNHHVGSVWGGSFDDDPGGLKLKHDRPGLLSAANSGPDTNSGHFSIVVAPAPHLDTGYTIFGEVVSGMDVVNAINTLDKLRPGGRATVEAAGCLANCAPRDDVQPKCKTRATETRKVQGRPMKQCID